jgi:hypothetical protein
VFLFTDNAKAESVYYKGNLSFKRLFKLMLRLRNLEMKGDLVLHVVHVAGTRMQGEGADGALQGQPVRWQGTMCSAMFPATSLLWNWSPA